MYLRVELCMRLDNYNIEVITFKFEGNISYFNKYPYILYYIIYSRSMDILERNITSCAVLYVIEK